MKNRWPKNIHRLLSDLHNELYWYERYMDIYRKRTIPIHSYVVKKEGTILGLKFKINEAVGYRYIS